MSKPRSDATLKTLPAEKQKALYEFLLGHSLAEAEAWLATDGIDTGRRALSEFFHWYPLHAKLTAAASKGDAIKEILTELPELKLNDHQLSQAAQAIFEAEAVESGDSKLFLALRQLRQNDRNLDLQEESGKTKARQKDAQLLQSQKQLELEREKFKAMIRTKVEAGLAEIAEQVKGNTAAEAALNRLQEAISQV